MRNGKKGSLTWCNVVSLSSAWHRGAMRVSAVVSRAGGRAFPSSSTWDPGQRARQGSVVWAVRKGSPPAQRLAIPQSNSNGSREGRGLAGHERGSLQERGRDGDMCIVVLAASATSLCVCFCGLWGGQFCSPQ